MRIAIHQPDYLPWPGFFHKMAQADLFVLLDDCGFSRQRATHRVQIRRPDGVRWLSVPVGKTTAPITELQPDTRQEWGLSHWHILSAAYRHAPYWQDVAAWLKPLLEQRWERLTDVNIACLRQMAQILGITTPFVRTSAFPSDVKRGLGTSGTRIVNICRYLGATAYYSGHGAKAYNDESAFAAAGVRLEYSDFQPPVYPQTGPDFVPGLSMIDLLANCGAEYAAALFRQKAATATRGC